MTLMGGPIDTRRSPTAVNLLAEARGSEWFRATASSGAVSLSGRAAARLSGLPAALRLHGDEFRPPRQRAHRHVQPSVEGDGDSAEKHREFYDEYLAVMDLTAEFYLQTVETVFVRHSLPKGEMTHRGEPVDLQRDPRVALMTVEGENDDISGVGQTQAAHDLCANLPAQ